jgi:anti-anti-sigma regulatory factor
MEFKIDTKPSYTLITPVTNELNAKLTDALRQKWIELTNLGSKNFIVDLHNCLSADVNAFSELVHLHEECYNVSMSLVFTNVNENVLEIMKKNDLDFSINITPSLAEAVDIVSMEILERDLFNEE